MYEDMSICTHSCSRTRCDLLVRLSLDQFKCHQMCCTLIFFTVIMTISNDIIFYQVEMILAGIVPFIDIIIFQDVLINIPFWSCSLEFYLYK